jgi:hypothetical protein
MRFIGEVPTEIRRFFAAAGAQVSKPQGCWLTTVILATAVGFGRRNRTPRPSGRCPIRGIPGRRSTASWTPGSATRRPASRRPGGASSTSWPPSRHQRTPRAPWAGAAPVPVPRGNGPPPAPLALAHLLLTTAELRRRGSRRTSKRATPQLPSLRDLQNRLRRDLWRNLLAQLRPKCSDQSILDRPERALLAS